MSQTMPTPTESASTCFACHFFDKRTKECRRYFAVIDRPGSTSCQEWMSPVRRPADIDEQLIEDLRHHHSL